MDRLHFDYRFHTEYEKTVSKCFFSLKIIPKNTARQTLKEIRLSIVPEAKYWYGSDSFNNKKILGMIDNPHTSFELKVSGEVEINQVLYEEEAQSEQVGIFKYPHGKTVPGPRIISYSEQLLEMLQAEFNTEASDYDKAIFIMHDLYNRFNYVPNVTGVYTMAEDAMVKLEGVCQDIAHIYIAVIRRLGIAARYVTGLMIGEGKSHAWVEFLFNGKWIGLDPTNDLLIDENYIKLSDGRDSDDCKINLATLIGGGREIQSIESIVSKIND